MRFAVVWRRWSLHRCILRLDGGFFTGIGDSIPRSTVIADREPRERIQSRANEMQTISDQAYFYAGLSFGITFARWGWPW